MTHRFSGSKLAVALFATTAMGMLPHSVLAQAAEDNPVRFRVEGFAGTTTTTRPIGKSEKKSTKGFLPSLSFSYGEAFNGQVDLIAADHAGDNVVGGAMHLGFKTSENTNFGVYASKVRFQTPTKLNSERLGVEFVYQGDKTSFTFIGGNQKVGSATVIAGVIPGFTVVDTYGARNGAFSIANMAYYPQPDWALSIGHRYAGERHTGVIEVERAYRWGGSTVSLFAEGRFGNKANSGAWVGLRVRFGSGGSSLKDMREKEVYTNHLKDDMYGIENSRRRTDVPLPPPPPPPVEEEDDDCVCGGCYAA